MHSVEYWCRKLLWCSESFCLQHRPSSHACCHPHDWALPVMCSTVAIQSTDWFWISYHKQWWITNQPIHEFNSRYWSCPCCLVCHQQWYHLNIQKWQPWCLHQSCLVWSYPQHHSCLYIDDTYLLHLCKDKKARATEFVQTTQQTMHTGSNTYKQSKTTSCQHMLYLISYNVVWHCSP